MDQTTRARPTCPRCGRALTSDAPEGLCPACVLAAGLDPLSSLSATQAPTVASGASARDDDSTCLAPGQTFGPYRIGRLLGRGGMGEVYEAEHPESGRRLALKVLRQQLRSGEDRARFLREGQLAASISHPHTVYIFGSEEIGGMPAISMELLPGGTLKDRVSTHGPLPPEEAVAAVLDIIGGLDAAQAAGILHRDIKPSNCFIDLNGTVKVGDFGLSISTLARDVGHQLASAGFEGTPQFAAPEQLRGEPLDLRADIYAVGATLYYLLTGEAPFDAPDLQALVLRVTTEPPPSPRARRTAVSAVLAAVVQRCLAKHPTDRPATYAALAADLAPYAPGKEVPAGLIARLMAGIIDGFLVDTAVTMMTAAGSVISGAPIFTSRWTFLVNAAYYAVVESLWGASLGKRLFGLRVTALDDEAWWRILVRTAVLYLPLLMVSLLIDADLIYLSGQEGSSSFTIDRRGVALVMMGAFFLTCRRRNGFAAIHELASGTRVVVRKRTAVRAPAPTMVVQVPSAPMNDLRFGPFVATGDLGATESGRMLTAFDPILRRNVWIHRVPTGTPAISPARRDVARIGRLHWLMGRRTGDESWDAFEAPDGGPFSGPAPWPVLKHQLLDLTRELAASLGDGTLPPLGPDRVWGRASGRLVLLDFARPRLGDEPSPSDATMTPVRLLAAVATSGVSLHAPRAVLPLSARLLMDQWSSATPPSLVDSERRLSVLVTAPDHVSSARRALPIGLAAGTLLSVLLGCALAVPALVRFTSPENTEMLAWLDSLQPSTADPQSRLDDPAIRTAVEQYVSGRYGSRLVDPSFWQMSANDGHLAALRRTAEDLRARYPAVSPEDLARAASAISPEILRARQNDSSDEGDVPATAGAITVTIVAYMAGVLLLFSVLSSLVVRGGIVTRAIGLAAVTRGEREIAPWRSVARALIAWSPVIVWLIYLGSGPRTRGLLFTPAAPLLGMSLALGAMAVGAVWTLARPGRGPHDWLSRTWVVPR